ncbi:MAG: hypothetical protein AB2A00_03945 [Myxococcota bacterium]
MSAWHDEMAAGLRQVRAHLEHGEAEAAAAIIARLTALCATGPRRGSGELVALAAQCLSDATVHHDALAQEMARSRKVGRYRR